MLIIGWKRLVTVDEYYRAKFDWDEYMDKDARQQIASRAKQDGAEVDFRTLTRTVRTMLKSGVEVDGLVSPDSDQPDFYVFTFMTHARKLEEADD